MKLKTSITALLVLVTLTFALPTTSLAHPGRHHHPKWVSMHSVRVETRHVYFPAYNFYYDINRDMYIYLSGGNWIFSAFLPVQFARIDLRYEPIVELDFYLEDPYIYNDHHIVVYRDYHHHYGRHNYREYGHHHDYYAERHRDYDRHNGGNHYRDRDRNSGGEHRDYDRNRGGNESHDYDRSRTYERRDNNRTYDRSSQPQRNYDRTAVATKYERQANVRSNDKQYSKRDNGNHRGNGNGNGNKGGNGRGNGHRK